MLMYLPAKNVSVFPFSSERVTDPASHILNEKNITRLVQKLTDYSSYVVSFESDGSDYHMEFVIEGYYYDVRIPRKDLSNSTNIYAKVDISEDDLGYRYLSGGDYTEFDGGDSTEDYPYLVQKGVSTFRVPVKEAQGAEAWFKFKLQNGESVRIQSSSSITLYRNTSDLKISSSDTNFCTIQVVSTREVLVTAKQDFALLVKMTISEGINTGGIKFISDGEVNTLFTGVKLVSTAISATENPQSQYALHILTVDESGTATVPAESLHRIKPPALHIDRIVCEI